MKSFTKVLIALFTISIFTSCNELADKPIINPTITLTQGEGECSLLLSDNELTKTYGNNLVTWECGSGVSEIVDIYFKSGDNVFQVGPRKKNPNNPNSDWFGITKNTQNKLEEQYGIKWKDSEGNTCDHDPTIKVEPNEN